MSNHLCRYGSVEDQGRAVTILDAGRMHLGLEDQTQGIDQDMALAPLDFLTGIKADMT